MKKIMFLFLLATFGSAHAATIDRLLDEYGKDRVIETIREKMYGSITIDLKGDLTTVYGPPNQDLVNSRTIQHDLDKLGISLQTLESIIQEKKQPTAKQEDDAGKAHQKLQEYYKIERHTQKPPENYRSTIEGHMGQYPDNQKIKQNLSISKPKKLMLMNPMLDLKAGQVIFISKVSYQVKAAPNGDIQKKNSIYAFRGEKIIWVKEVGQFGASQN